MKISLLEPIGISREEINLFAAPIIAAGHEFNYYDEKTTDVNVLKKRADGCDILMIANNPLPNEVIAVSKSVKAINVAFTGIDHIGLEECRNRNITIMNAAGYSNETVSELAVGLAIGVLRKIVKCDAAVRNKETLQTASLMGTELGNKTVGIIGTGRIGVMTARLFKAFGCEVIGFSNSESQKAIEAGVKYMPLDELLKKSDVVSLHIPFNEATKGFLNAERIALMKKSAILINCARGGVVDNNALANALNGEMIAGAAIDVFDMEPPIPLDYPLLNAKNTVLTPHVAFASKESMQRRAKILFKNLEAYLNGQPQNIVKI